MKKQRLLSYVRKAIEDYEMINEGDKIAIGISGGKDSITLLHAMKTLQYFYPKKFEIYAITIDLGFDNQNFSLIIDLCEKLGVPYKIVRSEIANIIFNERKEKSPCSLCAKMRKGALNKEIKKLGCNKVAYGHHKDDIVETMMLSLIYEGRFHSFSPKTYLDRMDLTVIRPLMYVSEMDIKGFINKYELPVAKSKCPADGYTKRQHVKELLKQMNIDAPGTTERMFTAVIKGNINGWPKKTIRNEIEDFNEGTKQENLS